MHVHICKTIGHHTIFHINHLSSLIDHINRRGNIGNLAILDEYIALHRRASTHEQTTFQKHLNRLHNLYYKKQATKQAA